MCVCCESVYVCEPMQHTCVYMCTVYVLLGFFVCVYTAVLCVCVQLRAFVLSSLSSAQLDSEETGYFVSRKLKFK